MPLKPRLRRKQQPAETLAELGKFKRMDLKTGFRLDPFESLADMQNAWSIVGERLLAEWIQSNPGTRPFAWWICEHKQERPIIGDHDEEYIQRERAQARFNFLHTRQWPLLQQNEFDYLREHGLLSADEIARHRESMTDSPEAFQRWHERMNLKY